MSQAFKPMSAGDPVAPAPVAEPGTSTTEFRLAVANAAQAVVVAVFAFVHLPVNQQAAVIGLESALVTLGFAAYAYSRGLRKAGTNG